MCTYLAAERIPETVRREERMASAHIRRYLWALSDGRPPPPPEVPGVKEYKKVNCFLKNSYTFRLLSSIMKGN